MIKKAPSYITSDNQSFASLNDAKSHELATCLFDTNALAPQDDEILKRLTKNAEAIIAILKTKERKPRESKAAKTKKKVKAAVVKAEEAPV